jgi:hypothetical protein
MVEVDYFAGGQYIAFLNPSRRGFWSPSTRVRFAN